MISFLFMLYCRKTEWIRHFCVAFDLRPIGSPLVILHSLAAIWYKTLVHLKTITKTIKISLLKALTVYFSHRVLCLLLIFFFNLLLSCQSKLLDTYNCMLPDLLSLFAFFVSKKTIDVHDWVICVVLSMWSAGSQTQIKKCGNRGGKTQTTTRKKALQLFKLIQNVTNSVWIYCQFNYVGI